MEPSSPRPRIIRRDPRVAHRGVADGGGVLLHLDTGAYHSINPTGEVIWDTIGDGATVGEIAASVAERFDIPLTVAVDDVEHFVGGLADRGLVEITESGPEDSQ